MAQPKEPFSGWGEFTNKIWEESPNVFYFLASAPEYTLYLPSHKSRVRLAEQADNALKTIRKSLEYKRLIRETKDYLAFVDQQWENNKKKAFFIIKGFFGSELPVGIIAVYLTHPKLKNGLALNENTIVWGHPEDFKNYTTVYLCHELMHILTKFDNSDITHAAIELMVDNELRIKLNRKGKYFEYPGHARLQQLKRKLLPDWKRYLKKKDESIFSFVNQMKEKWGQP